MKKKKIFSLLFTSLILTSCQAGVNRTSGETSVANADTSFTSSSGGVDSSGSSAKDEEGVPVSTAMTFDELNAKLIELSEANSYAVNYEENNYPVQDVYTKDYVYFAWKGGGYVTLDSYDSQQFGGNTLAYEYALYQDESIEVLSAQSYEGKYVHSAFEYNYLPLYQESSYNDVSETDFKDEDGVLYTEDTDLLYMFSLLMGYDLDSLDSTITGLGFELSTDNNLIFHIYEQPNPDSSFTEIFLTGEFTAVNKASFPLLENYFSTYKIPDIPLTSYQGKSLKSSTVSVATTLELAGANSSTWSKLGEGKVDTYKDKDPSKDATRVYINDTINNEAHEYIYTKGVDGKQVVENYVDGQNNVQHINRQSFTWNKEVLTIQDQVDLSGFRKTSEGNYHYFGGNAENIFESLTHLFVSTDLTLSGVRGINLSLDKDGTLTIVSDSNVVFYNEEGTPTYYRLRATSKIEKTPRTITVPTKFDETSKEATDIKAIFDKLKGVESYKATGYAVKRDGTHDDSKFTLTFIKDKALIIDQTDGNSQKRTVSGYKQTAKGVIPFSITLSLDKTTSVLKATDKELVDKTLGDYVPFTASPAIFKKEGQIITSKEGVKEIGEYIFGGYRKEWLLEPSLTVTLDSKDRPSKINYNYVAYNYLTGKEEASIEYTEQSLPSYISQADFDSLVGSKANASWADEEHYVYDKMKAVFTEEKAKTIPYLYDQTFSNTWHLGNIYADGEKDSFYIYSGLKDDVNPFLDKYVQYISSPDIGFVEKTIDGRTYFVKDNIGIRVFKETANGYDKGIYFRVIN